MSPGENEILTSLHYQAGEIQRLAVLCLSNRYVEKRWRLKMIRSYERLGRQMVRLLGTGDYDA